jgi:cation transport protein ChaC
MSAGAGNDQDLWVFGYGSLMWRPGFPHLDACPARIFGYHRALCVWSWFHRGTPVRPGLVFGLERGGSCLGRVYRVAATDRARVEAYLYEREMVTAVYRPHRLPARAAGRVVQALAFVVDHRHAQYAGGMTAEAAAQVVAAARGASGPNPEYVINTHRHLRELGIRDPHLDRLCQCLAKPGADDSMK